VSSRKPVVVKVCSSDRYAGIADLHEFADNPRLPLSRAEEESLDASLASLGLFRLLLVWEDPDVGVPVTVYTGSRAEARIVALRDNNSEADWDYGLLSRYVTDLDDRLRELGEGGGLDMALAGFDDGLLADLMDYGRSAEAAILQAAANSPESPEAAERRRKKPGDAPDPGDGVGDPADRVVGVNIGHVRGRIRHATYDRLTAALRACSPDDTSRGLDPAFERLLELAGF